jgi:transposase
MSTLNLKEWQRSRLREQLVSAADSRIYRRTLAVLEVDRGHSVADVAEMLGVTRQSVHNWVTAFARDPDPSTLADGRRSGRPPEVIDRTESALRSLMPRSPRDLGYPDADWTVPLLQRELERGASLPASVATIRRGLRRLGYVREGSRFVLKPGPGGEGKAPHLPREPGAADPGRRAGRGLDRPVGGLAPDERPGAGRGTVGGRHQRPGRPMGGLRGDGLEDRGPVTTTGARGPSR